MSERIQKIARNLALSASLLVASGSAVAIARESNPDAMGPDLHGAKGVVTMKQDGSVTVRELDWSKVQGGRIAGTFYPVEVAVNDTLTVGPGILSGTRSKSGAPIVPALPEDATRDVWFPVRPSFDTDNDGKISIAELAQVAIVDTNPSGQKVDVTGEMRICEFMGEETMREMVNTGRTQYELYSRILSSWRLQVDNAIDLQTLKNNGFKIDANNMVHFEAFLSKAFKDGKTNEQIMSDLAKLMPNWFRSLPHGEEACLRDLIKGTPSATKTIESTLTPTGTPKSEATATKTAWATVTGTIDLTKTATATATPTITVAPATPSPETSYPGPLDTPSATPTRTSTPTASSTGAPTGEIKTPTRTPSATPKPGEKHVITLPKIYTYNP